MDVTSPTILPQVAFPRLPRTFGAIRLRSVCRSTRCGARQTGRQNPVVREAARFYSRSDRRWSRKRSYKFDGLAVVAEDQASDQGRVPVGSP